MSAEPTIVSVSEGGWTATTNTGTTEQVTESLRQQEKPTEGEGDKPDISKAASELGKRGGEAAAKAREKAAKEAKKAAPPAEPADKQESAAEEADEPDEAEAPPAENEARKGNPRHDPKARVQQATREAREAREEAARLRAEREQLARELEQERRARQQPAPQERAQPQAEDDPEPEEGDFELHKDYVKALARWEYRQEAKKAAVAQRAQYEAAQYAREVQELAGTWQERLRKAKAEDADFERKAAYALDEIGRPSKLLPYGTPTDARNWIADYLSSAGDAARDLLLYLSEHKTDLQRIATLSKPHAVARELAMIEARLSDAAIAGTSSEREVSRANPPVTPVTGSPSIAGPAPRAGESDDEWFRRNLKR